MPTNRDFEQTVAPPAKLKTSSNYQTWGRIVAVFIASIMAAGFMPGQSDNIALFADAGIFSSQCKAEQVAPCDEQYAALGGVFGLFALFSVLWFVPIGFAFDSHGGRKVGTLGAALTLLGYAGMLIPIVGARSGNDAWTCWVTPAALALTDFGCLMNSYALYAFIYHLPGRSTFIIALSNSSLGCAAFLPSVMRLFMVQMGLGLAGGMMMFVLLAGISVLVFWMLTPTKQEFHFAAQRALGMPLPKVRASGSWKKIGIVLRILRQHWLQHASVWVFGVLAAGFVQLYLSLAADFGKALFGAEGGRRLAADLAWYAGLCNMVIGPLSGVFVDRYGLGSLAILMAFTVLGCAIAVVGQSWSAQFVTSMCIALLSSINLNFIQKHVIAYMPANRLGVGQGFFIGSFTIGLLPVTIAGLVWVSSLPDGPARFITPFGSMALLAAGVGCVFMPWYAWKGPPDMQVLLPEDEKSLAFGFGCASMSQVEEVVGLPKRNVMQILSKMEPDAISGLVARVEYGKLREVLLRSNPPPDDPSDASWDGQAYLEGRLALLPSSKVHSLVAIGPECVDAAAKCAAESYMGSPGADPDLMHDWIIGPRYSRFGSPAMLKARSFIYHANLRFMMYSARAFGCALGVRDEEGPEEGAVRAVGMLYPPGRYLRDGGSLGGSRFVHTLKETGEMPAFLDKSYGMGVRLRINAAYADMATVRENMVREPHWYIMNLGVAPQWQGQGLGRQLLDVIGQMADQDGAPCCLETAGDKNKSIYEKFGYVVIHTLVVEVDDEAFEPSAGRSEALHIHLMLRPARKQATA